MLYNTLDKMVQEGTITRELKEGGDPENPDHWVYQATDEILVKQN